MPDKLHWFQQIIYVRCRFINVEHLFACPSFALKHTHTEQKKNMLKILISIKWNVQFRKQWTVQMSLWQFTCSSSSISLKCGCVWPFFMGFSLPNVSCQCMPSACHFYQAFKSNLLLSLQFKCLKSNLNGDMNTGPVFQFFTLILCGDNHFRNIFLLNDFLNFDVFENLWKNSFSNFIFIIIWIAENPVESEKGSENRCAICVIICSMASLFFYFYFRKWMTAAN